MKVKSIAECSPWSILQYFWPALRDNGLENQFSVVLRVAILHRFCCMIQELMGIFQMSQIGQVIFTLKDILVSDDMKMKLALT